MYNLIQPIYNDLALHRMEATFCVCNSIDYKALAMDKTRQGTCLQTSV